MKIKPTRGARGCERTKGKICHSDGDRGSFCYIYADVSIFIKASFDCHLQNMRALWVASRNFLFAFEKERQRCVTIEKLLVATIMVISMFLVATGHYLLMWQFRLIIFKALPFPHNQCQFFFPHCWKINKECGAICWYTMQTNDFTSVLII